MEQGVGALSSRQDGIDSEEREETLGRHEELKEVIKEMLQRNDTRPRVMVIHSNNKVARFFDGALRNGCQVEVFRNCAAAMKSMKREAPDLVLCELTSMTAANAGPFRALLTKLDILQPPIVLVSADRFEDHNSVVHLKLPVLDCISQSINPQLLLWKVKNVLSLKQVFDRFHETMSHGPGKRRALVAYPPGEADNLLTRMHRTLFSAAVADLPEV